MKKLIRLLVKYAPIIYPIVKKYWDKRQKSKKLYK